MPAPTRHVHVHAAGTPHPPDPAWKAWDDAWTRQAAILTGRTDLTVVVAPGAGGGAPELLLPRPRAASRSTPPTSPTPRHRRPARPGHKRSVPTGYGLLVHGAAHAAHSRWDPPPGTPPILAHVADLLEESRAESANAPAAAATAAGCATPSQP